MHDVVFENQSSIKRNDLIRFAAKLGLDIAKFNSDLNDPGIAAQIEEDQLDGEKHGVSGTPMMFVNGRPITGVHTFGELQAMIEDELKIGPQSKGMVANNGPPSHESFDLSRGPTTAEVTITWYSDLSSPLSAQADQLLKSIQATYPHDVRVVFKNRPVAVYAYADQVHQAAMAAAAQNKFWEMEQQLVSLKSRPTRVDLLRVAKEIGLDTAKFTAALDGGTYRDAVAQDVLEARGLDVRGSPVFFVNSIRMDGLQTLSKMQAVIEAELKRRREAIALRASTSMGNAEKSLPTRTESSRPARTAEVESK
jgi:protein-disulfide isomerase